MELRLYPIWQLTAILEFWLPVTPNNVCHSSVENLYPKNVELFVGMSLLCRVQAEISAFQFNSRHPGFSTSS
jgi:hypothetical protein